MKINLNKPGVLLVAALAGPAHASEPRVVRVRWLMGTACEADVRGPNAAAAVEDAFDEIARWDGILSLYKEESELNALNRSAGRRPHRASPELFAAVAEALRLAQETGGAFDPTILPVLKRGPAALPLVGWSKVRLDRASRTVFFEEAHMGIDSGAWGKGWALDRAAERLRARGVVSATLNFGGQVLAIGEAPAVMPDGSPVVLKDESLAVSGDSERPGHISSPFDGRPVRRAASAAAILPSAAAADAWSTALYVLGEVPPAFKGRARFTTQNMQAAKGDRP